MVSLYRYEPVIMFDKNGIPSDPDKAALNALGEKLQAIEKSKEKEVEVERSGMGEGLKYASEFSAAIIVGAALGYFADKYIGTAPWGLVIGLMLGLGAAILNVVRAAKEGMDGSGIDLPPEADED